MKKITIACLLGFLLLTIIYLPACKKNEVTSPINTEDANEEYSGGLLATTFDFSENAFGHEVSGLQGTKADDFVVGNSFFRNNWVTAPASTTARDGLGVMLNAQSCGGCHSKDGRAAPPESPTAPLNGLLFRLSVPGTSPNGSPNPEPVYGGQLNNRAILGVTPEGYVSTTYTEETVNYPDGETCKLRKPTYTFTNLGYGIMQADFMFSPRIANQVMGLGLLEAIPEATILAFADENDADKNGISGRPNKVYSVVSKKTELGRFGWKANQPTIMQQTAGAFKGDIGITSSLFPDENLTPAQAALYPNLPNGGTPEIEDVNLNRVVFYMRTLAVPGRRNTNDASVIKGKQLFTQVNCVGCHKAKIETGFDIIPQLSKQVIRPYTDLLLHDMGTALADNRPDFLATGTEWRTPPLWGLGLVKTVNGHTTLLHDGRARNVEEAILWHGGEAEKSKQAFKQLNKAERLSLIKFTQSL
ncbi:MAG: thiol oxidoreductase [Sphingobacteriales bacterium]|nr:MAG: thiol oxidoreductase [Sphingobacteriales bacterium]TAF79859.1 MAG: thiol oxidoreductase [Sphingobacteriales bacterium]